MKVKMGKEALQRYARTLYEMDHSAILVRELLQNAIDACDGTGREPEISVAAVNNHDGTVSIQVVDNGVGMNADVLENAFLSLGVTTKTGGLGGFGIAAATVFGSINWEVETNDLKFTSELEAEDLDPVRVTPGRTGTRVTALTERKYFWERAIARLIYTSAMSVELHVIDTYDTDLKDMKAGCPSLELREFRSDKEWSIKTCDPFTIPLAGKISGTNFFRLNGNTQFYTNAYGRTCNAFIDLMPLSRPGEDEYPLSLAREELRGDVKARIQTALEILVVDEHSVKMEQEIQKYEKVERVQNRLFEGDYLHSLRSKGLSKEYEDLNKQLEDIVKMTESGKISDAIAGMQLEYTTDKRVQSMLQNGTNSEIVSMLVSTLKPADLKKLIRTVGAIEARSEIEYGGKRDTALLLYNYEKKSETANLHGAIVDLWESILKLTVEPGEAFGIGITSFEGMEACRQDKGGAVFYVVNAEAFAKHVYETPEELVLMLWKTAAHEAAHKLRSTHDEKFMLYEFDLSRLSLPLILANMKDLKKGAKKIQQLKGDI
jgi:hypothetical protein